VQAAELLLISSVALIAVAWFTSRHREVVTSDRVWVRALIGIVPGVIGALIILVTSIDLLPDDIEEGAWLFVLIVISAIAIAGTTYRLARR
jgi:hypothetical protein